MHIVIINFPADTYLVADTSSDGAMVLVPCLLSYARYTMLVSGTAVDATCRMTDRQKGHVLVVLVYT